MLKRQDNIEELDLDNCQFDSDQTEKLLRTLTENGIFNSLTTLRLCDSTEFDSDESVRLLALILAKAPKLKYVDVYSIYREREIYVEVDEK